MRRSFTVIAPIATGVLVFALAASYPASAVRGNALIGPKPPASVIAAKLPHARYRLRWADHDRVIVLRVRDGAACRPRLLRQASTGPARLEVSVDRPSGADCVAMPRWWNLDLRPPTIRAAPQSVTVYVNGDRAELYPPPLRTG